MAAERPQRSLMSELRRLAARFGDRFDFGTQRTRDGISLVAARHRGDDQPGLYAVITNDPEEMRDALQEDQDSPPGREAPPGGG